MRKIAVDGYHPLLSSTAHESCPVRSSMIFLTARGLSCIVAAAELQCLSTTRWGIEVERFEMKDVELPEAMQQVMRCRQRAIRGKGARIIKAEAELEASKKLAAAAEQMADNPVAVELRRMQMVAEVGGKTTVRLY